MSKLTEALRPFIVRTKETSEVDLLATQAKFNSTLLSSVANEKAQDGLILDSMSQLYDAHKGAYLNLPFIRSQTVEIMAKTFPEFKSPLLFGQLSKRIGELLHEHTGENKTYNMKKGNGFGFCRARDQAPKPVVAAPAATQEVPAVVEGPAEVTAEAGTVEVDTTEA